MKLVWVFEEYRDSNGIGRIMPFDDAVEAYYYWNIEWDNLSKNDKQSYIDDPCGTFDLYSVWAPDNADLGEFDLGACKHGKVFFTKIVRE